MDMVNSDVKLTLVSPDEESIFTYDNRYLAKVKMVSYDN